jgi:hypothetical protein
LPDLHIFYNFNWITHILAKSIKWFVYSFKWYLGILQVSTTHFCVTCGNIVLYPRWPPWLKIEISSNGQNCSILSQNVPKFELCKHNDELFSMYDRIFYELWTFADFSGFRGEDLNVIFYQNMPNLHNRYISAERKISQKNQEYMLNYSLPCSCS